MDFCHVHGRPGVLSGAVFGAEHATGILRRDRHALEAMLHVIVVKMSGIELFDMRLWGEAAYALEPAVERLQGHDAVDKHKNRTDGRK